MFDGHVRKRLDPAIGALSQLLSNLGFSANSVTLAGCALGLGAALAIALGHFMLAAGLIAVSRLCDGLDGGIAKIRGKTDLGGYLDIVLDFVFYGAVPLGFAFAAPSQNALPAAALIFSFYVNGASFLAYAILAEKRQLTSDVRGSKSIFFTTGLAEATETIAVFLLACLFPAWFPVLAWGFAAICLYTASSRMILASQVFR